jgi:hypothetical protein
MIEDFKYYEENEKYIEKRDKDTNYGKGFVVYTDAESYYDGPLYLCNNKSDNKFLISNAKIFKTRKQAEDASYWATVNGRWKWKVKPL